MELYVVLSVFLNIVFFVIVTVLGIKLAKLDVGMERVRSALDLKVNKSDNSILFARSDYSWGYTEMPIRDVVKFIISSLNLEFKVEPGKSTRQYFEVAKKKKGK